MAVMQSPEDDLRRVAVQVLKAGFNRGDLKAAPPEKTELFGQLVSALRRWVGDLDAIDNSHTTRDDDLDGLPINCQARTIGDMVTQKQIRLLRMLARDIEIDLDLECEAICQCSPEELSKRAASALIKRFRRKQGDDSE